MALERSERWNGGPFRREVPTRSNIKFQQKSPEFQRFQQFQHTKSGRQTKRQKQPPRRRNWRWNGLGTIPAFIAAAVAASAFMASAGSCASRIGRHGIARLASGRCALLGGHRRQAGSVSEVSRWREVAPGLSPPPAPVGPHRPPWRKRPALSAKKISRQICALPGKARRHLNAGQLAVISLDIEKHLAAEAKKRQAHGKTAPGKTLRADLPKASETDRPREQAAKITGASGRSIQSAKKVEGVVPATPPPACLSASPAGKYKNAVFG